MVTTQQFVRGQAEVITVVTLSKGDVYKRIEKASYGETYKLMMGVVTDVADNGTNVYVTATEFDQSYEGSAPTIAQRVFSGDMDLQLFSANAEEVSVKFEDLKACALRGVKAAQDALSAAQAVEQSVTRLLEMKTAGALQPALTRLTLAAACED